jgi:hypothetical protein
MVELESDSGSDPTDEIILALEESAEEFTRDVIMHWFEKSQNWLEEAAENRSEIDSQGMIGREQNSLHAIQQTAVPPSWDKNEEHWSFSYPHAGAVFQEFGARPHEIRAKKAEVLAFEWPDAPRDIQEEFEHTEGDLVFFESVNHPGIPAIGFVRRGRDKTRTKLERQGYDVEEFEEGGGVE